LSNLAENNKILIYYFTKVIIIYYFASETRATSGNTTYGYNNTPVAKNNIFFIAFAVVAQCSVKPIMYDRCFFYLQSKSLDQKRLWCQQMKRVILDNYIVTIPDKAKQLVMMLGKSREEGATSYISVIIKTIFR